MDIRPIAELQEAVSGALEWWRDAGVDTCFQDDPVVWTKPEEAQEDTPQREAPQKPAARPEPAAAKPAIDTSALPADLETFSQWWMSDPALDEGRTGQRIPPRGEAGAKLMVVVPEPEASDTDRLLCGPEGKLLAIMLAAMNIGEGEAYFASVLPRATPGADWQELASSGIGGILAHHVSLVRPERLAVFGTNILPLIGNDPPQGPADSRIFNHGVATVPMLAARSLGALLNRPRWKAGVWQAWLDLTT